MLLNGLIIGVLMIAGWLTGALVNYLADVLPTRRRLAHPFCANCQAPSAWINYLFWPRGCAVCGHRRSARVWLVEIIYIAGAVGLWVSPPGRLGFLVGLILLAYFGVVAVIDLEYRLILHPVSLFGAALGLGVGSWLHGWKVTLLGGVGGFGIMLILYFLGEGILRLVARLRGQSVEDVALGFGDVSLSGVLGLILGWPGIVVGLFLAVFIGGAVSLAYILVMVVLRRYHLFMALPYGPFLLSGAILLLYFRDLFFLPWPWFR